MTLTITHTEADGTLLEGSSRGDGTAELVKALGWRWGRSIGLWYLPRSRDAAPKRHLIDRAAAVLREAGHQVEIAIDDTHDPAAVEQHRTERGAQRAERLTARAERHHAEAGRRDAAFHAIADSIPLGQPILAGHHSERRARRDIARMDANIRASLDHEQQAREAATAAHTAARAADARNNPVTVANRIERLSAEIRGHRRVLRGTNPVGHADYLAGVAAALQTATQDLEYWQHVRDQQIATGAATNYNRETVRPGDLVKISGQWRTVVRASVKSVSVKTGYSWTDRAPWARVQDHRPQQPDQHTHDEHQLDEQDEQSDVGESEASSR